MISKIGVALTIALLMTGIQLKGDNPQNTKSAAKGTIILDFQMEGEAARELRDSSIFGNHARLYGKPVDRICERIDRKDGGKALRLGTKTHAKGRCWGFIPRSASLEAKKMIVSFEIHPDEIVKKTGHWGLNLLSGQVHVAHYRKPKTVKRAPYHNPFRLVLLNDNRMRLVLALKGDDGKIKDHYFTAKKGLAPEKSTKVEWVIDEKTVKLSYNDQKVQSWPKKGEIIYDHPDFYPGNTAWQFGCGVFKGWLDNFKIIDLDMKRTVPVAITMRTNCDHNFYTQKEAKTIQVGVENCSDKEIKGTLKYKSVDVQGEKVFEGKKEMTLKPAQNNSVELIIPSEKRGCFWLKCDFVENGKTLATRELNYAVGAIRDVSEHPDSSPFGIQIMPRKGEIIPAAGLKWIRYFTNRQFLEPEEGEYNWGWMDEALEETSKDGRKVMACLFGMPIWAVKEEVKKEGKEAIASGRKRNLGTFCRGYPPADWKKHEEFLRKLITRYKDKVDAWEIWNEANTGYWDGTPEEYIKLMEITHRLVREIDPDAIIVGPSICRAGMDGWANEILEMGAAKYLDVFAGHYFGGGYAKEPNPECVPSKTKGTRKMLDMHEGEKVRIWDGECGYLTATRHGPDFRPLSAEQLEKRQKAGENFLGWYLNTLTSHNQQCDDEMKISEATVRRMVLCLANGVEKTFIHQVGSWDYEADLQNGNRSKGTCVLLPTIAWNTMVDKLVHADCVRKIDLGNENLYGYLFKNRENGKNVAVFWSAEGRSAIAIDPDSEKTGRFDIWGNPVPIKGSSPKRLNLTLTKTPFYLENIGDGIKILPQVLSLEIPSLLSPGESAEATIIAKNPSKNELKGEISIKTPKNVVADPAKVQVSIAPGAEVKKLFKLSTKSDCEPGKLDFEVSFDTSDDTLDEFQTLFITIVDAPLVLTEPESAIVIDGDPSDPAWKSIAPQKIEREKQVVVGSPLCYADPTCHQPDKEWVGPDDLSAQAKICLKDGALHVLVEVKDNKFTINKRGKFSSNSDCVELFIDGRPTKEQTRKGYGTGVHHLLVVPGNKEHPQPSLHWRMRNKTETLTWPIALGSQKTKDGYVIEAKIPLDKKRFPDLDLKKGGIIGFDIALDDADGAEKRKSQMVWRGSKANYIDASKFGKLKIEGDK